MPDRSILQDRKLSFIIILFLLLLLGFCFNDCFAAIILREDRGKSRGGKGGWWVWGIYHTDELSLLAYSTL